MDVGTGSGILAVWAAQAGAKRVYAVEYTDMAKYAERVMEANGVSDIVTVIQGAVEEIELPSSDAHILQNTNNGDDDSGTDSTSTQTTEVVDIIISEWMGYFLLRESMLDSLIRARDKFLKKKSGLMFPSHTTMYIAPVQDEEERRQSLNEYFNAMGDWSEFAETTKVTYGVEMSVLEKDYEKEQKNYYLLSSRWSELRAEALLAEPSPVKFLDMCTCTLSEAKGIYAGADNAFEFDIPSSSSSGAAASSNNNNNSAVVSALAGWFTADFKSRTDDLGMKHAPKLLSPAVLSTGPEDGYTHWGQQTFHFLSSIPLIPGETTCLKGSIEMTRTKENTRLYNARIKFESSRRKCKEPKDGNILMKGKVQEHIYQIP